MSEDEPEGDPGRTGSAVAARMDENAGRPLENEAVACPYCGSTDTRAENARGPSLCRTIYYCTDCESPFERFG